MDHVIHLNRAVASPGQDDHAVLSEEFNEHLVLKVQLNLFPHNLLFLPRALGVCAHALLARAARARAEAAPPLFSVSC